MKELKIKQNDDFLILHEGSFSDWASRGNGVNSIVSELKDKLNSEVFTVVANQKEILIKSEYLVRGAIIEGDIDYKVTYKSILEKDTQKGSVSIASWDDDYITNINNELIQLIPSLKNKNESLTEANFVNNVVNKVASKISDNISARQDKKENKNSLNIIAKKFENLNASNNSIKFETKLSKNANYYTLILNYLPKGNFLFKINLSKSKNSSSIVPISIEDCFGNSQLISDFNSLASILNNVLYINLSFLNSASSNSNKDISNNISSLKSKLSKEVLDIIESLNEDVTNDKFKKAFQIANEDEKLILCQIYLEENSIIVEDNRVISLILSSVKTFGNIDNVYFKVLREWYDKNDSISYFFAQTIAKCVNYNVKIVQDISNNPNGKYNNFLTQSVWTNINNSDDARDILILWNDTYNKVNKDTISNIFFTDNKLNTYNEIKNKLQLEGIRDSNSLVRTNTAKSNVDRIINDINNNKEVSDRDILVLLQTAYKNDKNGKTSLLKTVASKVKND